MVFLPHSLIWAVINWSIPKTPYKDCCFSLRPVSTSANSVARTGTIACSSIKKKQSDWLSLILVAKKLNLIQLPELTARSPVNARFQLGFRAVHALIAHPLVARPNSPKWKPALTETVSAIKISPINL